MINWAKVTELHQEIGTEDFDEVVELFLDELHMLVEKLQHHPVPAELESDLHLLKGCALNLGFSAFAEKCHTGEWKIANGQGDQLDLPGILACFQQSKSIFQRDFPKGFAA